MKTVIKNANEGLAMPCFQNLNSIYNMKIYILIALQLLSCIGLQAQKGIGTSNPDPSSVLELKSTTKGFLPPRLTTAQRNAIVSPASGMMIYNNEKNCLEWYNGVVWYNGCGTQESSGGSAVISGYANTSISSGILTVGTAATGVSQTITATVTTIGTYFIKASANGVIFTKSGTFITTGAQDIVLTATGTPIVAATSNFVLTTTPNYTFNRSVLAEPLGPVGGNAICDGSAPTKVVPIISTTGKTWMDRNLGASRAGISFDDYQAYGGLYQWGRGNDGHAGVNWTSATTGIPVNATTTTTLSSADTPGHVLFIVNDFDPSDWRSVSNDNLWQGINGINNPCPSEYRVPTDAELTAEITKFGITNAETAYESPLKFVAAGNRYYGDGGINYIGSSGSFWSSTVNGIYASFRYFDSTSTYGSAYYRALGYSVRCIKN
jgi:hypothetical protein